MSKLVWDEAGKHFYENGCSHGVLFVMKDDGTYETGVAWSGLTSVSASPSGGESNDHYADNTKYLSITGAEDFGGTIEAFTYPDAWNSCNGVAEPTDGLAIGQQTRHAFGFSYRTIIGNDAKGQDYGYKIHLVYNAKASPSEMTYETVNDSPEPTTMSWEFKTTPVAVTGYKPTAHIVIDSTKVDADKLKAFEDTLYGADGEGQAAKTSSLPTPDDVIKAITGTVG